MGVEDFLHTRVAYYANINARTIRRDAIAYIVLATSTLTSTVILVFIRN